MADIEIGYKGSTITSINSGGVTTLNTIGTFCEDNITVTFNKTQGEAFTPATTITTNPSITLSATTGTITAFYSGASNITPTVTSGYISAGTAGTVRTSGTSTYQLSTVATQTITPTTASQLAVASGRFTTGNIYVGAIPIPAFDVTWDDDWMNIVAVTCNMTYAECAALTNSEDHRAIAYEHDQSQTYGFYTGGNNDTYRASYIKYTFGKADYDVHVNSNGTITWNYPSSDLVTPGTPTASKGSVSNHSVSVTPSVTNPYGYIVGGTITGSPVTVSASELVSGTLSITSNGTHDVTNYASATVNVSGGGGGGTAVTEKQVNFIDYDGTILYSYTKAEAEALTALPANPSHSGLVAQGWNWTLAQIKSQLTADPDGIIWVGQTYVTVSGDSEIDVTLVGLMKEPYLGIAINGTVTIDWGDSTTDTVSGTSLTTQIRTKHSYASDGDYTISIHADSGSYAFFGTESYTLLSYSSSSGGYNRVYSTSIRSIRIGNDASIGNYAFAHCHSLKSISIPSSITALGTYVFDYAYGLTSVTYPNTLISTGGYDFYYCYGLKRISLPYGLTTLAQYTFAYCTTLKSVTVPLSVTSIGNYCFSYNNSMEHITIPGSVTTLGTYVFNYMYSLHSVTLGEGITTIGAYDFNYDSALPAITIPSTVTSMGGSLFNSCYGLGEVHMLPTTPPTLGTSAFYMATGGKIYVPSASLSDYQTAENWNNYASRMVGE